MNNRVVKFKFTYTWMQLWHYLMTPFICPLPLIHSRGAARGTRGYSCSLCVSRDTMNDGEFHVSGTKVSPGGLPHKLLHSKVNTWLFSFPVGDHVGAPACLGSKKCTNHVEYFVFGLQCLICMIWASGKIKTCVPQVLPVLSCSASSFLFL